jgi:hypothetical protein
MRYKYAAAVLAITLGVAGVVWSQSGPTLYSLQVLPGGATSCSALNLLSPSFYKCSNMQIVDPSGAPVGTADWGYTNGILVLTLEIDGDVTNYAVPAGQTLTRGTAAYPSCSAEWTIRSDPGYLPEATLHLGEYRSSEERARQGCRPLWRGGTVTH